MYLLHLEANHSNYGPHYSLRLSQRNKNLTAQLQKLQEL